MGTELREEKEDQASHTSAEPTSSYTYLCKFSTAGSEQEAMLTDNEA